MTRSFSELTKDFGPERRERIEQRKAETGHETHRQIGPIAQELEQVCPGLVFDTPDRDEDGNETGDVTKGINQSVLYMKAVKALQEAMERIEVLKQRLTDAGIA